MQLDCNYVLLACTSCSCAEKYAIHITVYVNTSHAVCACTTTTCEYRNIVCIIKAKLTQKQQQ